MDKDLIQENKKLKSDSGFWTFVKEMASVILLSLLIVAPIKMFIVKPFIVKGASMEPNFHGGEYLIVNEIGWKINGAKRGDVIIFKSPRNEKDYLIKRIIGLPGEKVEVRSGKITIYQKDDSVGFSLDEDSYLPEGRITKGNITFELGEDEYCVLGDNRNNSSDSRDWGKLDSDLIVGKTWVRLIPFQIY